MEKKERKPKFWAKELQSVPTKPGCWNYLKVGVFTLRDGKEEQIGEYQRNYHALYDTFHWFTQDGKDYALYSPDYTSTRILSLPDCKDLGGEPRDECGFCPVEYYVPSFQVYGWKEESLKDVKTRIYEPEADENDSARHEIIQPLTHEKFGFVAGCVWGDDHSWKIQYLDLSEASKGILKREERFGYLELPRHMDLKKAIDMDGSEVGGRIDIATQRCFDLKTGKCLSSE